MGKKVYAVRVGRGGPAIYASWPECQAATAGVSGAVFKSFPSRAEAEAWLAGGATHKSAPPPPPPAAAAAATASGAGTASSGGGSKRFFAVVRGYQTGVLQGSWAAVKPLVDGFAGAQYKGFATQAEAQAYYEQHGGRSAAVAASTGAGPVSGSKRPHSQVDEGAAPPPAFTGVPALGAATAAGAAAGPSAAGGGAGAPAGVYVPLQQLARLAAAPQQELHVTVWFDGGSRHNPGRAGYGYAIFDRSTHERLRMACKPMPFGSTNNEAEYAGMIAGLRYARDVLRAAHVVVKGDSELVVRQMNNDYRVSSSKLMPLFREAQLLMDSFGSCEVQHVYREENLLADQLSNLAMNTDWAVDKIASLHGRIGRREAALLLAQQAQAEQPEVIDALCTAPSLLSAAAGLLGRLWDDTPQEEVAAQLLARGWSEDTGGPPEQPAPPPAAAGGQLGARGGGAQQVVAVAAVGLGAGWAAEIQRQEGLLQQQQPQRQVRARGQPQQQLPRWPAEQPGSWRGGGGGSSSAGGMPAGLRRASAAAGKSRGRGRSSVPPLLHAASLHVAAAAPPVPAWPCLGAARLLRARPAAPLLSRGAGALPAPLHSPAASSLAASCRALRAAAALGATGPRMRAAAGTVAAALAAGRLLRERSGGGAGRRARSLSRPR